MNLAISEWSSTRLPSERFKSRLPPNAAGYQQSASTAGARFLDRVVGFEVSPLLWAKIARGLSAGRVQSVAVRLIVEREREIRAFVPEEYWDFMLTSRWMGRTLFVLKSQNMKEVRSILRPSSRPQRRSGGFLALSIRFLISRRGNKFQATGSVHNVHTAAGSEYALGFSVKKTMTLAQRLYEAGNTYMRTDSTNLSGESVAACRTFIEANFSKAYLPESPIRYGAREGAQEAHEAIRPSNVELRSESLKDAERDAQRLYELIWRQFVACQMTPARYLSTTVTVSAAGYDMTARGRVVEFDGYTRVQTPMAKKGDDAILPDYQLNDRLSLNELLPTQHFTKPPARYGEASLVRELEKRGIGRPSTYAAIISTIQDRGYVKLENRRFYAEKMGDIVTQRLQESFEDLLDYGFTASMEENLDDVAEGRKDWRDVLDAFYDDFRSKLDLAEQPGASGMQANEPTPTGIACGSCGRSMQVRTASTGVFLGCSGYNLPPKERCKSTVNLIPGDEVVSADADDEAESRLLLTKSVALSAMLPWIAI